MIMVPEVVDGGRLAWSCNCTDALEEGSTSVVVVTGLSGAGKGSALKVLEDMGYEVVDNLPLSLLEKVVCYGGAQCRPLALCIDIRTRDFGVELVRQELDRLKYVEMVDVRLVYIDCEDEVLCRRFTETRRRHPLALTCSLTDGIHRERQLVSPLRDVADLVIDSSQLLPIALKQILEHCFPMGAVRGLVTFVLSFAFRKGLPHEADLVFDVRFLCNPHYDTVLKPRTGRDSDVATFIANDSAFTPFFNALVNLLGPLIPRYEAKGKNYLTIAIGCTGGRHRSVFVAEQLTGWLRAHGTRVQLHHRELEAYER